MRRIRIISCLLSVILIFSTIDLEVLAVQPSASEEVVRGGLTQSEINEAASYWYDIESEEHVDIDYGDIEYQRVDISELDKIVEKFRKDLSISGNEKAVIEDYYEIIKFSNTFVTQAVLINNYYYGDVTNEEYADEFSLVTDQQADVSDKFMIILRDALLSEYADIIRSEINNETSVEDILDYEDMTPRQKEINRQINDLQMEYDTLMQQSEAEYEGKLYSYSNAREQYNAGEISYDELVDVYNNFVRGQNLCAAEIYIQLVNLLNESARLNGDDNYAISGYNKYYRDYTVEEIKVVYDYVKQYIVPLYEELNALELDSTEIFAMDLPGKERFERLEPVIVKIDPGLVMAWDYLYSNNMYDIDSRDTKALMGYTTILPDYGAPFFFDSPYGNFRDLYTVVHEFGHYNDYYHNYKKTSMTVDNLDICEIESQGLEALSFAYADEIFGKDNAYAAKIIRLQDLLYGIIDGCLYDEFQVSVYEYEGELTVEKVNTMFHDLAVEYGYDYSEGQTQDYEWINTQHTFNKPMYYISYATSALAALDILAMSIDNYQAAVDCYMNITVSGSNGGFQETLEMVGLPNIFDEGVVEDISIAVDDYVHAIEKENPAYRMRVIKVIIVVCVAVVVIAAVVVTVLMIRRKKRKTEVVEE